MNSPSHTPLIDYSVYPDADVLPVIVTDEEQADYVHRICGAWDFGIVPTSATFTLFAEWRDIFDRFQLPDSLAYHAFRVRFGWPSVTGFFLEAPYERHDRRERRSDPYVHLV